MELWPARYTKLTIPFFNTTPFAHILHSTEYSLRFPHSCLQAVFKK
jgi:hypothetical protein